MFARSFVGKFSVCFDLWDFESGVIKFQAHIADVHGLKAVMAVGWDSFSWKEDFSFWNLIVAAAADFESDSSDID